MICLKCSLLASVASAEKELYKKRLLDDSSSIIFFFFFVHRRLPTKIIMLSYNICTMVNKIRHPTAIRINNQTTYSWSQQPCIILLAMFFGHCAINNHSWRIAKTSKKKGTRKSFFPKVLAWFCFLYTLQNQYKKKTSSKKQ